MGEDSQVVLKCTVPSAASTSSRCLTMFTCLEVVLSASQGQTTACLYSCIAAATGFCSFGVLFVTIEAQNVLDHTRYNRVKTNKTNRLWTLTDHSCSAPAVVVQQALEAC